MRGIQDRYSDNMMMSKKLEEGWGKGATPPPMVFGEASKKEATRIMLARLRNIRQREEKR